MQDDQSVITHETEEGVLKALTDAVFEANHLSAQFTSEQEKKEYNHFAVMLGQHPLERQLALSVDSPIEYQIQLVRKIHQEIDFGAENALASQTSTPQQLLNGLLLKMDELPASMRVLGNLSILPDKYKNNLVFALVGFFAATATYAELKRSLLSLQSFAELKSETLKDFLDKNGQLIDSLRQKAVATKSESVFDQMLAEMIKNSEEQR